MVDAGDQSVGVSGRRIESDDLMLGWHCHVEEEVLDRHTQKACHLRVLLGNATSSRNTEDPVARRLRDLYDTARTDRRIISEIEA